MEEFVLDRRLETLVIVWLITQNPIALNVLVVITLLLIALIALVNYMVPIAQNVLLVVRMAFAIQQNPEMGFVSVSLGGRVCCVRAVKRDIMVRVAHSVLIAQIIIQCALLD